MFSGYLHQHRCGTDWKNTLQDKHQKQRRSHGCLSQWAALQRQVGLVSVHVSSPCSHSLTAAAAREEVDLEKGPLVQKGTQEWQKMGNITESMVIMPCLISIACMYVFFRKFERQPLEFEKACHLFRVKLELQWERFTGKRQACVWVGPASCGCCVDYTGVSVCVRSLDFHELCLSALEQCFANWIVSNEILFFKTNKHVFFFYYCDWKSEKIAEATLNVVVLWVWGRPV